MNAEPGDLISSGQSDPSQQWHDIMPGDEDGLMTVETDQDLGKHPLPSSVDARCVGE